MTVDLDEVELNLTPAGGETVSYHINKGGIVFHVAGVETCNLVWCVMMTRRHTAAVLQL